LPCIFLDLDVANGRYVFGENRHFIDTIIDRCPSGGVVVNDVMMHAAISDLVSFISVL